MEVKRDGSMGLETQVFEVRSTMSEVPESKSMEMKLKTTASTSKQEQLEVK